MTQNKFNKFLKIGAGLGIICAAIFLYKNIPDGQPLKSEITEKPKSSMVS